MGRQRKRIKIWALILTVLLLGGCDDSDGGDGTTSSPVELSDSDLSDFSGPGTLSESIDGDQWLNQILFEGSGRVDARLPNYSYYQGLIQSGAEVRILGQVRIVGGVIGANQANVRAYSGAMVTTNPYAFTTGQGLEGGPLGIRTRVGHWEEVPTP